MLSKNNYSCILSFIRVKGWRESYWPFQETERYFGHKGHPNNFIIINVRPDLEQEKSRGLRRQDKDTGSKTKKSLRVMGLNKQL